LKNSTLRRLSESVIFTPSSPDASWSGDGRKSRTTSASIGSSVYLILLLINAFTFAPISGADDSNPVAPVGEAYGEHATSGRTEAIEAILGIAVREIARNHAPWIEKTPPWQG